MITNNTVILGGIPGVGGGGTVAGAVTYSPSVIYNEGDLVEFNGVLYTSLVDINENNQPDISPNFWTGVTTPSLTTDIIGVSSGTIDVGDAVRISEGSNNLFISEHVEDTIGSVITSKFTSAGSSPPAYFDLEIETNTVINSDDTTNITTNPLTFTITATANRQVNKTTFKTYATSTNVRGKFIHVPSGTVIKYFPSKYAYDQGVGGYTITKIGDIIIDFVDDLPNDETNGLYYIAASPFRIITGDDYEVEIIADSPFLKGDALDNPYLAIDAQIGVEKEISLGEDANLTQTTGLLGGGVISIASSTTVSWTAGNGIVTDFSDPNNIVVYDVSWDTVTGYTPTNIATDGTTLFGYDKDGSVVEILAPAVTPLDTRTTIFFGTATHLSGNIVAINTAPGNLAYDRLGAFKDFINLVIGPANIDGNVYGPNGVNLNIDVEGGPTYMLASNFRNETRTPDIITLASGSAITFYKLYREADPSLVMAYDGLPTTSIDPTQYDDGSGTLQTVTAGYWTIQRIFRGRTGQTFVAYGQQEFSTKELALEALGQEPFEEKMPLPLTLYRGSLVVIQSATDLSDTDEAEFFAQSSFRISGAISASATIPGITSPGGIDRSVQFNDAGTFGGSDKFVYTEGFINDLALQASGGPGVGFRLLNSSGADRLIFSYSESSNFSIISADSNNLSISADDSLTFGYGSSQVTFVETLGNNAVTIKSSASDKDVNLNIENSAGQTVFKVEHNDVSGQTSLDIISDAAATKFALTYNSTLDDIFLSSGSGSALYLISDDSLFIDSSNALTMESNNTMTLSALGNYNVIIKNDESTFAVTNSTGGYAFSFSNVEPNTEPLLVLAKDHITGGVSRVYVSNTTPEGVITANGGALCIVSDDANSNIYLKLNDSTNTTWQSLLGDIIGPDSSTDNAIATYNGTTGLLLQNTSAFIEYDANNTRLLIDNNSITGQSGLQIRTNLQSTRFSIIYNQTLEDVFTSTTLGVNYYVTSGGQIHLDGASTVQLTTSGNNTVTLSNANASLIIGSTSTGNRLYFQNDRPDTDELILLNNTGLNGGTTQFFLSSRSPEGNITGNGGDLCIRSDSINSDMYIKRIDGGNTGWVDFLHSSNGVQGPVTRTDNAIAIWDGTDGLNLQDSYSSIVSTASSTLLSVDNVLTTGESGFQIRNNLKVVRYAVTYNQTSNTVLSTTTSGASYTGVYDGSYQQETFSNVAIGSLSNQLVELYNSGSLLRIDVAANGGRLYFNNTTADTEEMIQLVKGGTNGGTIELYVTSRSPLGNITANGGSFAFRDDGTSSNFYLKRVDGGTTGWNVGITKDDESSTLNSLAIFDVTTGNSITDASTATLVIDTNSTALELKPVTSAGNAEVNFRNSLGFIKSQIYHDEDVDTFNIETQSNSLNIGNFAGPIKFASSSVDSAMYLSNTYPVAVLSGNPGDINVYVNGASSEKFINKGSVDNNRVWSKFALDSDTNAYGGFGRLQNRIRWSEDLANAVWVDGLGNTTIIPDATVGPNGELVDNVQWDSAGLGLRQNGLGTVDGNNYTVSFWAKHISGVNQILIVDINDGGATGLTIDSNEWQRYHITLVAGAGGQWIDFTHNSTSTFALWGVQVNDGIEIYPYLKREDIALKDTTEYGLSVDGKIIFTGSVVDSDDIITNLTTGVLEGGVLSINGVDDSLIDVTAGKALIADYSTPGSPNIREISWDAQTIDPNLGGTEFIKWIGVQESATAGVGEFVFDIEFTQLEKRTIAIVGRCWGDGVTDTVTAVGQYTTTATGQGYVANDLSYVLGSMNKRGNVFSANGANLLLDKTAGVSFRYSADYSNNPTAPHVSNDLAQTGITTYWYLTQNALVADIQPDIDPDNWDDGGTKTAVPTGKYTLQRLYYYPVSQLLAPTYGQELFNSMGEAIGAAGEDIVEVPQELLEGAILRGWIALKQGATALNDTTQALIKEARSIGDQPAKGTVGTTLSYRNYTVADIGGAGIHYYAGFYQAPAASTTLTIGGTVTQVYGTANIALGAHAFCVASGAGGTDLVLTVSGTSITEEGVRIPADSEIIVPDTDQATTNQYFETTKFWLGQITYTLTGTAGSFTFNYGFAKYDDFSNRDFTITDFQVIGQGAASETALDIQLLHHKATGWTYSAGAFVPGTGPVVSLANDYSTDDNLANNVGFAYKRTNLSTFVNGSVSEGLLVKFSTATNNSISSATIEIGALV